MSATGSWCASADDEKRKMWPPASLSFIDAPTESGDAQHAGGLMGRNWSNKAESSFADLVESKGKTVLRHGWPDFLIVDSETPMAIEVKTGPDQISKSQARMFAALEVLGIVVLIWDPNYPGELVEWSDYAKIYEWRAMAQFGT
jgi:hypothetical protein